MTIETNNHMDEIELAKQLLTVLWCAHDSSGISMGRSHESVVLEAAMALLGEAKPIDTSHGQFVGDVRDYLSNKRALKYAAHQD